MDKIIPDRGSWTAPTLDELFPGKEERERKFRRLMKEWLKDPVVGDWLREQGLDEYAES